VSVPAWRLKSLSFSSFLIIAQTCPKKFPSITPSYSTKGTTFTITTINNKSDIQGKMGSAAYQQSAITINRNVGNVTESYNNVWNNCQISNEKREILEWLSPMAPRERHQAVSKDRMDGVGNWLLGTNEFEKWHTSEDQAVNPVLFCHGDPGVGKTYLRCVKVALLEYPVACKSNSSVETKALS